MLRVLACLQYEHDYRLVLLAVGVCAVTATTAFYVHGISAEASGIRKNCWLFLTGLAAGCGIWTTHFVAMLAFSAGPFFVSYDPFLTFASLLIAILFTATGFWLAGLRGPWWLPAAGGVVIGVGIFAMHYTGMAAMNFAGRILWDSALVLASLVLGVVFAAIATYAFHSSTRYWVRWSAPLLLTLAICTLHFTAMGAAVLSPDPTVLVAGAQLDNFFMAVAITVVALIVTLSGVATALIDRESGKEVTRVHEAYAVRELRQRREAERLHHMAHHDALTGLPNRLALTDRLTSLIAQAGSIDSEFAVMFIDLDGFKQVNDRHGHATGDWLLRDVAQLLSRLIGKNEFVGRIGGDEFVIVQNESHQPLAARLTAERLIDNFGCEFTLAGGNANVGLSIGIAIYPHDGDTPESLLSRADFALYSAKDNGGGRACFCAGEMAAA